MPASRVSERLLDRLRTECGLDLPEGTRLIRMNAGEANRANGSWSWFTLGPNGEDLRTGSRHTMTELAAAPALVAYRERDLRAPHASGDTVITTPEAMD
ncbi:hypothetical protein [Streptomyces sp. G1]|uniref:hypothetical protein n=1 Tax=Streptomyces sp. G1 TaxID=361572 RepID=UPI00202E56AD|nr:hypothetical protein [Streptomyces sp. G1]MCM1964864.1 hypothetical protein [Streptomyces sp. G1]